jgi:nondiscriminating glutamyl-tRNA synthetase
MIRTRFAPSPTGHLHIGGARTALFNWLFARSQGGEFILRIDDTDVARNQKEALTPILDGLRWLGLDWDGEPVHQSDRSARYAEVLAILEQEEKIYRDYSTAEDRDWAKKEAEKNKVPFRWRGKALPSSQVALYESQKRPWAFRFKVPEDKEIILPDLLKGEVRVNTSEVADFVVARSDRSPLYSFATVVDEHDLGITHVLRAEEHLSNTFPQILLYEAMNWAVPHFGHMPYVAEPGSKQKLSKRKMAEYEAKGVFILVEQFIKEGYLPEAMLNYLARLGWSLDDHTEIFSKEDLLKVFTIDRIVHAPASHDQDKLYHIQSEWMKTKSMDEKVALAATALEGDQTSWASTLASTNLPLIRSVLEVLGDRFKRAEDINRLGWYFFTDNLSYEVESFDKRIMPKGTDILLQNVRDVLSGGDEGMDAAKYENLLAYACEHFSYKKAEVNHAIRVAITGQMVGGSLYHTMEVLGKEKVIARINEAVAHRRKMKKVASAGGTDGE